MTHVNYHETLRCSDHKKTRHPSGFLTIIGDLPLFSLVTAFKSIHTSTGIGHFVLAGIKRM